MVRAPQPTIAGAHLPQTGAESMPITKTGSRTGHVAKSSASQDQHGEGARARVVVIDDDPVLALYLQSLLTAEGHECTCFADGESALHALTAPGATRPSLVLLDLSLPRMTGLDVLHALVHAGVLACAQVLMMSASASDGTRAAARAGGASAFLSKPVHLEHIRPWLPRSAGAV